MSADKINEATIVTPCTESAAKSTDYQIRRTATIERPQVGKAKRSL
jgi:hypothetical protein